MKKVTLITSFAPCIGGGATILRSLIPYFNNIEITWLYLNRKDIDTEFDYCFRIGSPSMGGPIIKDLFQSLLLWNGIETVKFNKIIDRILSFKSDAYWVVGHNEGILISRKLANLTKVPIHLSLHDDIPYGVFARSRRYKWLSGIAQTKLKDAMHSSKTLDVICEGMRHYYQQAFGINAVVIHPYIHNLPKTKIEKLNSSELVVGHIGSIYSFKEFFLFCHSLYKYAKKNKMNLKLILIGMNRRVVPTIKGILESVVDIPYAPETEAINRLAQCHFVYAMQTFNKISTIFRQTSLPTKLFTYVQARRPIFVHAPYDSTMASAVKKFKIGCICSSLDKIELEMSIDEVLSCDIDLRNFENIRIAMYGIDNVERIEKCLLENKMEECIHSNPEL